MYTETNECCDCAAPGYPCMGDICPNRHVRHYYCDKCHADIDDEMYQILGEDLCRTCAIELLSDIHTDKPCMDLDEIEDDEAYKIVEEELENYRY